MRKIILILALLPLLVGCKSKPESTEKWSIKMADMAISRWDSLSHYLDCKNPKWSYDMAMLGMAIDKLGNVDPKYSDYMKDYMDLFVDENGTIEKYNQKSYNIDYINPAKNLIILWKRTGDEKYKKALPQFVEQMENHPKTSEGGFWHKMVYPHQMWLDGLYMGSPFLAMYAAEFNDPRWFDIIGLQFKLVYEKTLDSKSGLLYHAWDESHEQRWSNPETGQSPHFWSRAMGWYLMAIVDVLDYLPAEHPDRPEMISILQKCIDALLQVRDPKSGCWFQVLDAGEREGNYIEGSGTAMYIYAMAKGANKGYLPEKYREIANEAFDDMVETLIITDEDGLPTMINICGGCGLGGDKNYRDGSFEYYTTEKVVPNDTKGVGPFIMAAIELGR